MATCYYCNGSARCAGCSGTGVQADGRTCALCGGNGRCQRCTDGQMRVSDPIAEYKTVPQGGMRSGIRLALLTGTALATLAWSEAAWADCATTTAGDGTVTLSCGNTITSSSINRNGNNPSTIANYQALEAPLNVTVNSGVTISGWGLIVYNGTQPASTTSRPLNVVNNGTVSHTVGWNDSSESDGLNIGTNSGPIHYSGNGNVTTNGTGNASGNFAGSTALVIGASGLGNSVTFGSLAAPVTATFSGEGGIRMVAENSSLDAWFAGGSITATRQGNGVNALDIQAADSINLTMTGRTVVNGGIGVSLTAGPGHNPSSLLTIATDAQVTNAYSAGAGLTAFSREAGANVTLTSGALFNVANIGVVLSPNGGAARFTTEAGSAINQTGTTGALKTGLYFTPTGTGSLVADLSGTIAATGTGMLLRPANGNATAIIRSGASVNGDVAGIQLSQAAGGTGVVDIRNAGTLAGPAAVTGSTAGTAFTLTNSGTMNGAVNLTGSAVATSLLTNAGTWNLGTGNSVFSGSVTNSGTLNLSDASGTANTLTVSGNITFNAGSIYKVDVNAVGQSDKILASGAATINGGSVQVLAGVGNYSPATTYTILTAGGGRTGNFTGGVTSNLAFLDPSLSYDTNNVYLTMTRNDTLFQNVGVTPNQIATGGGIENLSLGNPVYDAVLNLSAPQARYAFDQLSGEIHASAKTVMLEDSRFLRNAVNDRIRAAFDGVGAVAMPVMAYADGGPQYVPATTDRFAVWGQAFGSWGHWNSDGNAARLDRSIGGFFIGADSPVFDTWRFGAIAGYSRTSFNVKDRHSSGASDNYHVGFYGGTTWGDLAFRTGAAYTWHDISTWRSVTLPGFGNSLRGDYNAATAQVFGELAHGFSAGRAGFEPFANLAYVNLHTDGFTELGGLAALASPSSSTNATFTTLGLRTSTTFDVGGSTLTAKGMLGWRHAFGDVTPLSTMRFAGGGSTFSIGGVPIARNAAVVEAGLDYAVMLNATLGISYNSQLGSGVTDQSVRATFNMKF